MNHQKTNLSASINVEINGILALTTYTLTYINKSETVEEAIYHFTLPRMGALIGCKVHIDGRCFEGAVQKRREATETYERAFADGKRTVLIESLNDGIYAINAGNITPAQQIDITLVIASAVTAVSANGDYTYRLPTNIAPRYRCTDNDIEPTYQLFAQYPFEASISSTKQLRITSSSHAVVEGDDAITFKGELDRDIFLSWKSQEDSVLYTGTYAGFTYTMGYPIPSEKEVPLDMHGTVQLVLDRSGSMRGASITLARQAAANVVGKLKSQTKLNVVSFGNQYETLFAKPRSLDTEVRKNTRQYLSTVEADMGGTELESALIATLKQFSSTEQENHALLITDGHVHLDDESIAAIKLLCQQKNVHLHIVGVGYGVNEHLLGQLHSCSEGVIYVVNPNQELTFTIDNIGKLLNSGTQKTQMHWLDKPQWESLPKAHYHGLPQMAICNASSSLNVENGVAIKPLQLNEKWAQVLVSIAAVRQIIDLDKIQAEALAESLGILSPYTSLVMVESSDHRVKGHAHTKVIGQMLPQMSRMQVCDDSAVFGASSSQDRSYLDIPMFLRKEAPADPVSDSTRQSDSPKALLLKQLQGLFWRKARWSRRYLLEVGLSEAMLDRLGEIANKHGCTLVDTVIVYLENYATLNHVRLSPRGRKNIQKTTACLPDIFINEVANNGELYEMQ
jgi:uncharacterized protein YegL